MDKKKIICSILVIGLIIAFGVYNYIDNLQKNYFISISNTFQTVNEIKDNLSNAAESLSTNDVKSTTDNLKQVLDETKEKLTVENEKLISLDTPDKFVDQNKKISDCLKLEYNLMDRLKNVFEFTNEYEAVENFNKSKDIMTDLKEQSTMLNVNGNNFEEVFNISPVYEKIETYLKSRTQLRYDKDMKEQAEREAEAAAERARIERAKNTFYVNYSLASKQSKVELSTNDMTIHVGQTVYISLANDSADPGQVRWMSNGSMFWQMFDTESFDRQSDRTALGMKLTALVPGKSNVQIVPNYGDWNRAATFFITVIP